MKFRNKIRKWIVCKHMELKQIKIMTDIFKDIFKRKEGNET